MSKARTEGLITNGSLNVNGFLFSPDFDTSQSMHISEMMKNLKNKECIAEYTEFNYKGFLLPVVVLKHIEYPYKANEEVLGWEKFFNNVLDVHKRYSENIDYLQKSKTDFSLSIVNGESLLIPNNELFICKVVDDDCLIFMANPFVVIGKEDEFLQNPRYRQFFNMKLKKTKKASNSYIDNLDNRRHLLLEDLREVFKDFVIKSSTNGFVIGTMSLFFHSGYAILVGTKEDNETCFSKKVFPYTIENDKMYRLSKSEIEAIITEREEYEAKRKVVEKRLNFMETKLKEKGYSWTIICKHDISFEDDIWKTWMNAQVSDRANAGWFSEEDFIDWINMEGSIPYKSAQILHFAKHLEKISSDYKLLEIIPEIKTSYGDSGGIAKFGFKGNEIKLSLGEIKDLIYNISPIKKYTKDDFEKEFKKFNRKKFFGLFK